MIRSKTHHILQTYITRWFSFVSYLSMHDCVCVAFLFCVCMADVYKLSFLCIVQESHLNLGLYSLKILLVPIPYLLLMGADWRRMYQFFFSSKFWHVVALIRVFFSSLPTLSELLRAWVSYLKTSLLFGSLRRPVLSMFCVLILVSFFCLDGQPIYFLSK